MITFQEITKVYPTKKEPIVALKKVSFKIEGGEFVSIVGKSGAGKTTLVKLLIGREKPTTGSIVFQDVDICRTKGSRLQRVRKKIGIIYQDYKLLLNKTVEENLNYIMQVIGVSDETIRRDVPRVLEIVGLDSRTGNFPLELSGGEQQRLAIARALIHRPDIIVADEPTGNLDLYNTYEIINLLKKIHQLGTTVMLLTHDKEIIDSLKKRVITLEEGRVVNDDPQGKFIL